MKRCVQVRKVILCSLLMLAALIFVVACGNNAAEMERIEREAEYEVLLIETVSQIHLYAGVSESVLGQVATTWRNAIDARRDFNDALQSLYGLDAMQTLLDSLRDSNATIITSMRELQNPPERFESAYDALLELFEADFFLV